MAVDNSPSTGSGQAIELTPLQISVPADIDPQTAGFTIGDNTSLDFWKADSAATPGDQITEGQQFMGSLLTWTQDAATGLWNALVYVQATQPTVAQGAAQVTVNEVANPTALPADQRSSTSAVRMTAVVPFVPDYSTPDNSGLNVATGADGGDPGADGYSGAVRLADGTVHLSNTDFTTDGYGLPWGQTRTWVSGSDQPTTNPVNGNGWIVSQFPQLIDGTSTMMAVIGDNTLFFDQGKDSTGKSNDTYTERYFADETLVHDASAHKYTLTDSAGDQFVFNDFTMQDKTDQTKGLYQRGGLISYTAADGATATVNGHTTLGNITEIDVGSGKAPWTSTSTPTTRR